MTDFDAEAAVAEWTDLSRHNDKGEAVLAKQGYGVPVEPLIIARLEALIDALLGPIDHEAGTIGHDRLAFEVGFQRHRRELIHKIQAEARNASAMKDLLVPPGTGKTQGGLHLPGKG